MHSIKDCQEVIDEIDNEVLAGEVRYWFAGQKEKFLKELLLSGKTQKSIKILPEAP